MELTMTGVDIKTDISQLPRDMEVGVLVSYKAGDRPRYPSRDERLVILTKLQSLGIPISVHFCGSVSRADLMYGQPSEPFYAQRIQVNGNVSEAELRLLCTKYPHHEIITQHNDWNAPLLAVPCVNHSVLVDASGGRGLTPAEWVAPETDKRVGFAGGLGLDNIDTEFWRILTVAKENSWIDMEGKLRDDCDWLDMSVVKSVWRNLYPKMVQERRCERCGRYRHTIMNSYQRSDGTLGKIHAGGKKCSDCLHKDPEFWVGQLVYVKAWWNQDQPVLCAVKEASSPESLYVIPQEGNPHVRYIRRDRVIPQS